MIKEIFPINCAKGGLCCLHCQEMSVSTHRRINPCTSATIVSLTWKSPWLEMSSFFKHSPDSSNQAHQTPSALYNRAVGGTFCDSKKSSPNLFSYCPWTTTWLLSSDVTVQLKSRIFWFYFVWTSVYIIWLVSTGWNGKTQHTTNRSSSVFQRTVDGDDIRSVLFSVLPIDVVLRKSDE